MLGAYVGLYRVTGLSNDVLVFVGFKAHGCGLGL